MIKFIKTLTCNLTSNVTRKTYELNIVRPKDSESFWEAAILIPQVKQKALVKETFNLKLQCRK